MLAGNNEYGSIGNGTRTNYNEYTLVGNRNFTVEPETKTMKIRRCRGNRNQRRTIQCIWR